MQASALLKIEFLDKRDEFKLWGDNIAFDNSAQFFTYSLGSGPFQILEKGALSFDSLDRPIPL